MQLLLNFRLAEQHRAELQHEAEMAQLASQVTERKRTPRTQRPRPITLLSRRLNRANLSSQHTVVKTQPLLEEVSLAEIRPALQATFSVLHEVGLVSDYDHTFIEQFNETFERELVHQVQCHCV